MKRERKPKHFINKPVYPGGLKAMREFISKELKYPQEALELKKEGIVRIKYDIDYKGNVFNTYILSGVGYGCDEEADRIVRLLKFEVEKTRKVRVVFHKTIQIKFKLPKPKKQKPTKFIPPKIRTVQYNYVTTKTVVPKAPKKKEQTKVYNFKLNIK